MAISNPELNTIEVFVKGKGSYRVVSGITLGEFCDQLDNDLDYPAVAAIIDNHLRDVYFPLDRDCEVEMVDLTSDAGLKIYRRSVVFLMIKASWDLFPGRKLMIKHSLSNGLYCEFLDGASTIQEIEMISRRMEELVAQDLPINRILVDTEVARQLFTDQDQDDTVEILEYRNKSKVHVYELDGFYEYFYAYMVRSTGMLKRFKLLNYAPGMILQTPEVGDLNLEQPFRELPQLFKVYQEAKAWANMLNTPHLAAMNKIIAAGQIDDLIRINEALQEKKIAQFADMICNDPQTRLVLIAGPSSSGKTSFAQRLLIQLRVNGRHPVSISLDNYFVDKIRTPRDEDGDYDFEALEALKLDLFNDHLTRLIRGEEVEIPIYDFRQGKCLSKGVPMTVPAGEPIIIEGIHGLNDQLTWSIPAEQKFKIYVSALTMLNIDYTNRIPTTDCRLIRRIVRDRRTRGYSALDTIKRWPSVRRGEEKNIFPFQENADIMFNTSLVYEMSALKPFAEPILREIGPEHPEHAEARRLLKFLSYFRPIPSTNIPPNSILREFVGGSWFKV